MWQANSEPDFEYQLNPYDSFMRRHLQHYGYYTGRNQNYRQSLASYADWEKTFGYAASSGDSTDSDSDSDSEQGKGQDNKLQEELMRTTQLVYSYQDGKGMVPKLREPRNLYALAKELGPQQAARWPHDIQVIDERIKHLRYVPSEPEPFYRINGMERTPKVRGEQHGGRLVFWYEPRCSFYVRSRVGGTRSGPEKCAISLESQTDTTLIFESRFESGNLAKAVQVGEFEYELWLRYDLYSSKNTQWFYFRVSNTKAGVPYRFTIVNFMKSDSLYNQGMKPLLYSEKDSRVNKSGWIRSGHDIRYYKNNSVYETSRGDKPFYSLTWTSQLPHNHDTVYFAHCYPYTYTDLQDYLLDLSNDPVKSKICKQRVLCRTLAGNLVYVLTITSPSQNPQDIKHKKAVVLTARVHPGESNASWMMKGFLDYLTGNSADAKLLRDTFIFKIVPMLNPDGVIVGNYRCSLAGRDLNRNYRTMLKDSYPSVWHTKNMIRRLLQEREIIVYCDLHGHSRKQNVFIYGCENRHVPDRRLRERIFPLMLHKNCPDKFNFEYCKFKIQKSKEGTGRIVMWNLGILNSYTLEATFCGSTLGKKKGFHFNLADYEAMGYHFCDSLLDYCDPDKTKCANILLDLEERVKMEITTRRERLGVPTSEVDLSDEYLSGLESSDGGSDSSVSDGPPVHLQFSTARPSKKKKKLKTKKERDRVKEEAKKTQDTADDKKSVSHQSSHARQDKGAQTVKYTTANLKRPKSLEERTSGPPVCVQERCEERQQKRNEYLEALTSAYLRNGLIINEPASAPHFRYSGSSQATSGLPFTLDGLCAHHEQTFAAQYMAQQIQNVPSGENETDDSLRSQPSRQVKEKSNIKQHPNPFDESGKSGRPRTQIPSATFVNYETFNVSKAPGSSSAEWVMENSAVETSDNRPSYENLGSEEPEVDNREIHQQGQTTHQNHRKSGRQSRMGMYEEDQEKTAPSPVTVEMPDYLKDPHSNKGTRVKSVNVSPEDNSAIDSIRELRQSLASSAIQKKLSPTAGQYIKRLIEQTDEDLDVLTNEIQDNIEQEKKLVKQLKSDEGRRPQRSASGSSTSVNKQAAPISRQASATSVYKQTAPISRQASAISSRSITSDSSMTRIADKPPLHKEQTTAMKHERLTSVPLSTDDTSRLSAKHSPKQAPQNVNRNNANMKRSATSYDYQFGGSDRVDKGPGRIGDRLIGLVGERMAGRSSNNVPQVDLNGALDSSYYNNSNNTTYQLYTKMISKMSSSQGQSQGEGQEGSGSSSSTEDKQKLSEKKQEKPFPPKCS